jgi:hypothetical protein
MTTGQQAPLTPEDDPRGCRAVDLGRLALDDYRNAKIGDEGVLDLLVLAREALRG